MKITDSGKQELKRLIKINMEYLQQEVCGDTYEKKFLNKSEGNLAFLKATLLSIPENTLFLQGYLDQILT